MAKNAGRGGETDFNVSQFPFLGILQEDPEPCMSSRLLSGDGLKGGLALSANCGCDAIGKWEEESLVRDHGLDMPEILNWRRGKR